MAASFGAMWGTVFDQNEDAVLIATLSSNRIRVLGIQQQVTMEDTDTDDSQPLPATSSKLRPSKLKELLAGASTSNVCPERRPDAAV